MDSPPVGRQPCGECGVEFPEDRTSCPHCGRPQLFPNVVRAQRLEERQELDRRYQAGMDQAERRGCRAKVVEFEDACDRSAAVLCGRVQKLLAIANREQDLFAGFYDTLDLRFTDGKKVNEPDWNMTRPIAEIALLGSEKHHKRLHYAALTLTDEGLRHYGECHILLREEMVAHRTSAFEENSGVYVDRFGHKIAAGRRSDWPGRGKLCVAKIASRISDSTAVADFPALLLKAAHSPLDDEFVELHVFGELTFHSFRKIRWHLDPGKAGGNPKRPRAGKTLSVQERALRDYCQGALTDGQPVDLQIIPV